MAAVIAAEWAGAEAEVTRDRVKLGPGVNAVRTGMLPAGRARILHRYLVAAGSTRCIRSGDLNTN